MLDRDAGRRRVRWEVDDPYRWVAAMWNGVGPWIGHRVRMRIRIGPGMGVSRMGAHNPLLVGAPWSPEVRRRLARAAIPRIHLQLSRLRRRSRQYRAAAAILVSDPALVRKSKSYEISLPLADRAADSAHSSWGGLRTWLANGIRILHILRTALALSVNDAESRWRQVGSLALARELLLACEAGWLT